MKKLGLLILLSLTLTVLSAQSYTVESVPNPQVAVVPGFVSDPDNILSAQTKLQINTQIDSLWKINDTELAVVVLNSIGYNDENQFANQLFNLWGIGGKSQSNGVLLLVVMDIRRIVIRTGFGVEGILPDAIARRIISEVINPHFKNADYDAGILAGTDRIIRVIRQEPFEKEVREPINWKQVVPYTAAIYIIFILLTFVWIRSSVKNVYANKVLSTNLARYKAIRDQNNASYSMAGLIFPFFALIAILVFSRSAYLLSLLPAPVAALPAFFYGKRSMNRARREPIPCNECGNQMHMLSENEEDTYLKLSQQFEEQLNSVDYDVFLCNSCQNQAIFSLDKLSSYTNCPRCNTKAYHLKSKKTTLMPTYVNAGTERSTYNCKFCGFEDHHDTKIPRLRRSSAVAGGVVGGSMYSGRGGFSGGFGGGGFGGGMTGGGGASGGW